jgi:hypothetical protein
MYHLNCNQLKDRWEIMNHQNEVLYWGNLQAMEFILDVLNGVN